MRISMCKYPLMEKKIRIKTDQKRIRPDESEVERLLCDNSKIKFEEFQLQYNRNLQSFQSHSLLEQLIFQSEDQYIKTDQLH